MGLQKSRAVESRKRRTAGQLNAGDVFCVFEDWAFGGMGTRGCGVGGARAHDGGVGVEWSDKKQA